MSLHCDGNWEPQVEAVVAVMFNIRDQYLHSLSNLIRILVTVSAS